MSGFSDCCPSHTMLQVKLEAARVTLWRNAPETFVLALQSWIHGNGVFSVRNYRHVVFFVPANPSLVSSASWAP